MGVQNFLQNWFQFQNDILTFLFEQIALTVQAITSVPADVNWMVYWVLWHINLSRLFNAKSIFM